MQDTYVSEVIIPESLKAESVYIQHIKPECLLVCYIYTKFSNYRHSNEEEVESLQKILGILLYRSSFNERI